MPFILPVFPLQLSILNVDDEIRTVQLDHAGVKEAGDLAKGMSEKHPWFIVIFDAENRRQGAFLRGQYIDASISDDELEAIAANWQKEMRDGKPKIEAPAQAG